MRYTGTIVKLEQKKSRWRVTHLRKGRSSDLPVPLPFIELGCYDVAPKERQNPIHLDRLREAQSVRRDLLQWRSSVKWHGGYEVCVYLDGLGVCDSYGSANFGKYGDLFYGKLVTGPL